LSAEDILNEVSQQIRTCQKCELAGTRKNAVPGDGPANAQIMLIGEGPGFYENEQGLPFVGPAGKFLDELLGTGGLKRQDVFITNVVKCRPPGNREPQESELLACAGYLDRQIEAIHPLIIITLGRFSMARYFDTAKISLIHGRATWVNGRLIVPMYHPAAGLHQPSLKPTITKDFSQLPQFIEKAKQSFDQRQPAEPENQDKEDATQLSFF